MPSMTNIGGEADVDILAPGDEDINWSGDPSPVHEERPDASLASSAHVVLDPHG